MRATQKTQMPVVRRAFHRWKNEEISCFIDELRQSIADKRTMLFYTLRSYCADELSEIEDLALHNSQNCFYYATRPKAGTSAAYIDTEAKLDPIGFQQQPSRMKEFYLWLALEAARAAESGINFEFVQPLLLRAKNVVGDLEKLFDNDAGTDLGSIFDSKNIAVIQLGDVDAGSREMLPSLLAELVMKDAAKKKGDGVPALITTLVVDEAHNLLDYDSEQSDLVHDNTLRVFERVIKEGRKFGVFLCLASQRPSDISPTITSQIHNYFIHKLVNPNDIERIRKTVSFMGEGSLAMLSALGQGECIISGPSLYMPQYVYIEQLNKDNQPNSSDLQLFGSGEILDDRIFHGQKDIHGKDYIDHP